jgi:hypothetical protein
VNITERNVGECHYCGGRIADILVGQYGSREVWKRVHRDSLVQTIGVHDALTSDEAWEMEANQ